jgi:hypothetical protein
MFNADQLVRLYPRAWRERYAEEFLAMLGPNRLRLQQVIDILSGAIDAWLSADVRGATRVASATGGHLVKTIAICERNKQRYTARDGLIGAAIMLTASALFAFFGTALRRSGFQVAGEMVLSMSFPVSCTLSMPFWLMKHQPWKAQAVIVGGTLAILAAISLFAAMS